MNGRANDGVRTVHRGWYSEYWGYWFPICGTARGGRSIRLSALTKAPVSCKLCLRKMRAWPEKYPPDSAGSESLTTHPHNPLPEN